MTPRGLPHSDILGSSLVGSSPRLFAACYVLHRLSCQGIHLCALMYLLRRVLLGTQCLKLQSMLCAWTRLHVWHMKVLLYAVFNVRAHRLSGRRRPHRFRSSRHEPRFVPSKLNSAVPTKLAPCASIVLRETLEVRAAQPMLKKHRARRSHPIP